MQNPTGSFIVIEGSDGSGKSTQFKLLSERLKAVGYEIEVFKFPQYENESSYFVKKYLNGEYGPAGSISPYAATLFYALDRFEASEKIKQALANGKIVICDRYVGSNMAHQGGKFTDQAEQRGFFVWEDSLEYQLLGLPRPTINIFLKVPVEISLELTSKDKSRQSRNYTKKSHDEHEKDINHLAKSIETYDILCQLFPNDFKAIECVRDNELLSIPEINNLIWSTIKPILPPKPSSEGHGVTVSLDDDQVTKDTTEKEATVSFKLLQIKHQISLKLLFEISPELVKYDFSSYSWASTNYSFYTPDLPERTKQKYQTLIKEIGSARRKLDAKIKKNSLSKKLAYPATPLAALVSINPNLNIAETLELFKKLTALDGPEPKIFLDKLVSSAKALWGSKVTPLLDIKPAAKPEKIDSIISKLVNEHLNQQLSGSTDNVSLIEASPKNEFKLLVDFVYPKSDLSRPVVEDEIDQLTYQEKANALLALVTSEKDIGLEQLLYKFDITIDRLTLNKFAAVSSEYSLKIQSPTPRFGYDTPEELDEHSLIDDYLTCFDLSLELFSVLQALNADNLSSYAVMLGHKTRLQLIASIGYIKGLKTSLSASDPSLYQEILQSITAAHPIIGSALASDSVNVKPGVKK